MDIIIIVDASSNHTMNPVTKEITIIVDAGSNHTMKPITMETTSIQQCKQHYSFAIIHY